MKEHKDSYKRILRYFSNTKSLNDADKEINEKSLPKQIKIVKKQIVSLNLAFNDMKETFDLNLQL